MTQETQLEVDFQIDDLADRYMDGLLTDEDCRVQNVELLIKAGRYDKANEIAQLTTEEYAAEYLMPLY